MNIFQLPRKNVSTKFLEFGCFVTLLNICLANLKRIFAILFAISQSRHTENIINKFVIK